MTVQGDYAVKVTIRNGRILSRMRAAGIETQTELARRAGMSLQTLNAIVALRRTPFRKDGDWVYGIHEICAVLKCDPEDLFSDAQMGMALKENSAEIYMDEPEVRALASGDAEGQTWARIEAQRLLGVLANPRERDVLERRMAGEPLDEIAADYGVGRERIRQIECKGIRRIKAFAHRTNSEISRNIAWGE